MNIKEIIEKHIIDHKFDGLRVSIPRLECRCYVNDKEKFMTSIYCKFAFGICEPFKDGE